MCASTYPRVSWNGVRPAVGSPSTFVLISGNGVQPVRLNGRNWVAEFGAATKTAAPVAETDR